MKKITIMALAIATLFSCKNEAPEGPLPSDASNMHLTINVNRALSKAVEDGHPGNNGDKIAPKILTVTVLSYNNSGVELGASDLTPEQIKQAVWGNYQENQNGTWTPVTQNTKPTGVTIGLPKGTTHVDVVVNRAPVAEYSSETNINYFNYRDNKNGQNSSYTHGDDNFDRVILTTANYGKGSPLTGAVSGTSVPTYNMNFNVKPYLTRMEVYGAIDVAAEEEWIDGYGNKWCTMSVTDYEAASGDVADADGTYPKGAVKGTTENGFDVDKVYIPEYYWFRNGQNIDDPAPRTTSNSFDTEGEILTDAAGWVKQPHYSTTSEQVKWFPNRYYAVDVESVFINNIKVQSAERLPYMHQWPGGEADKGWPEWYKAFHIGGWHPMGSSTGNTFLCMGNMWDRIAEADPANGYKEIDIPEINGVSKMQIIIGKAKPIAEKSEYYSTNRNLGIANGKAAAYVIYPQAKTTNTGVTDAPELRHELPHIIIKVKLYKDAQDYTDGKYVSAKEFITLSLFSDAAEATGNFITNFKGGNIYRFNLNDLLYTFVGDVPVPGGKSSGGNPIDPVDPDPEMPESELIMTVKVTEWEIQNMFPVI